MLRRNTDIDRRSRLLRDGEPGPGPVVYWMSREQRVSDNWALLFARQEALVRRRPLLVVFCLVSDYPGACRRHYHFLLHGLAKTAAALVDRNMGFRLLEGDPVATLPRFLAAERAALLVTDLDPLRVKRRWKGELCRKLRIPVHEVDGHNVVPVWLASDKKEYGAYTLRPKLHRLLPDFLTDFPELEHHPHGRAEAADIDVERLLDRVQGQEVREVAAPLPGENHAQQAMDEFIGSRLAGYAAQRNDPCSPGQSGLSPYLHFGQLAPQRLALEAARAETGEEARADFLEELVVRRELADNYCWYEPKYDSMEGFPDWARTTLDVHRTDARSHFYTAGELETAATHDQLWNACQLAMQRTGVLHGYLRMYWAKKILEWSRSPEEAQATAILLNDRYFLDGRDPNGYTGIAWSVGGVHDRAWKERPVFGKIRYMNLAGCRRKFDVNRYIASIVQASLTG